MGLDITAYSHLKHIGKHYNGEWCEAENHIHAFAYDSFPQSFRGLPVIGEMAGHNYRFLDAGCYELTDATKTHGFPAGSYGGYHGWRQNLQEQFNPNRTPDGPFFELIWFADNEGTIGPDAARDLLADFREHTDRYQPFFQIPDQDPYPDWTLACELAADNGLISFH